MVADSIVWLLNVRFKSKDTKHLREAQRHIYPPKIFILLSFLMGQHG